MEKIPFSEFLAKFFPVFSQFLEEYNNNKKRPEYLFKTMLTNRFSVTQTWESGIIRNSIVAADVVAMDSNLPLKKRDSISTATGNLPKLGMKMQLKETDINDLNLLKARGGMGTIITQRLLSDPVKCANGVDERLEFLFLQGISNGVCVVADDYNTGVGIRVDFGYRSENKFGAAREWSDSINATPITDINNVLTEAADNGDTITALMMAKEAFDNLRKCQEAREWFANAQGMPVVVGSKLPVPTENAMKNAFSNELGLTVIVVNRSVLIEKNGDQTPVRPFNRNKVVFLTDTNVGELVYGQLAEETSPSKAAMYTKATEYTLIKRWHMEEPFCEMTSSQAIALPVIQNAASTYLLDVTENILVDDSTEVEGDANINVFDGEEWDKQTVVNALKAMGFSVKMNTTDAKIKEIINSMNDAQIAEFKEKISFNQ
ncbi:MAG: major capsid protein [Paludibacteraceae bacterium]|nr:major capsid protein [Paludibacteraceae bacterium]